MPGGDWKKRFRRNQLPAKKAARQSVKRSDRNRSARTSTRTTLAKARESIDAGDVALAEPSVLAALSSLDRAVQKGVLHKNSASRRKSRLTIKLNLLREAGPDAASTQQPAGGRQTRRRATGTRRATGSRRGS